MAGCCLRLLPLVLVAAFAVLAYLAAGSGGISFEALVHHRAIIDAFVTQHHVLAILVYTAIYIATVAFSLPGAAFLTVAGGFLFGLLAGTAAAIVGATVGATLIFLVARTALGEPLLRRASPRASQLAKDFREDAFSYLLFLRLVPAFPFFLVNLCRPLRASGLGPLSPQLRSASSRLRWPLLWPVPVSTASSPRRKIHIISASLQEALLSNGFRCGGCVDPAHDHRARCAWPARAGAGRSETFARTLAQHDVILDLLQRARVAGG